MRSLLGASFVLLGLISCGGGVSISTNASNVCSEIAEVACHNMYKCCSEGEIERVLGVDEPRTEPQCKEDMRRLCERGIARLDDAIEANRVRFDSETMNNCLEALVAPDDACATVDLDVPWKEACMNNAWVGLVADGGKCFATFECASKDSICANETCTARPGNGQPCNALGCASGHFCDFDSITPTCRPQLGAGSMCESEAQCLDPLFCDFFATTPTCTELRNGGETCVSDFACKSGDCLSGTCDGTSQLCSSDTSCGRRCVNNGQACSFDSTCGGFCSISTTTPCTPANNPCTALGETCVAVIGRCQQVTCTGRICSTAQVVTDYCEDAVQELNDITP